MPSEPGASYPGERLGRPETGVGSIAGNGRRFVSLMIDWALCLVIARGIVGPEALGPNGSLWIVVILVVENALLVGTAGATLGQRLVGVRVETLNGARPGVLRATIRAAVFGLGFPPLTLLWQADSRGLHELLSDSLVAIN